MDNYPIVVEKIFSEDIHNDMKTYVNETVPFLPVEVDKKEFIREYIHNVPFFVDVHHQLTDFASRYFGEKVKPSYCFLSMYKDGGMCPLHIDRPQCRYTIDYLIEKNTDQLWPICVSNLLDEKSLAAVNQRGISFPQDEFIINRIIETNVWHSVELNENDAVLYSGTHSWHYRPERLSGTANLVFFHFVPEDFDGPLN